MDAIHSAKNVSIKNNIMRISKGPQFNSKGGHIFALISLTFFILSINSLFTIGFISAVILLIIGIVILCVALDIRGIEINRDTQTIREYKAILWWRIGRFKNMSDYKSIHLLQENVVVRTSEYSDHRTDTFHYYRIYLVDEANNKDIFLAEFKNFYKAEFVSQKIASLTGMTYKNLLKKGIKRVSVV
jgi:hypothetical protein